MLAQCDSCSAKFDATGKRPGAVFKCPRCDGGRVQVPAAEGGTEAADEPAAPARKVQRAKGGAAAGGARRSARTAGSPRRSGSRRASSRREAPASAGMAPAAKIGIGVAAVAVVGVIAFMLTRGGDEGGGTVDGGGTAGDAGGGGNRAAATETGGGTPAATEATKSPQEVYQERRDALADADAGGRAELAGFCDTNGMKAAARELRQEVLLIDPDNAVARQALGFALYDGPARQFQGRWLDKEDRKLAAVAERFVTGDGLAGSRTSTDVFMDLADEMKRKMLSEFPEKEWLYAYGDELMPIPFFVLVEKDDGEEDDHRKGYADTLTTLHEAFYQRYQERFGLEQIERPVRVIFFNSKQSYAAHRVNHPDKNYADPAFIGGYYQPWEQQLITWRQDSWRGVLFHEGTHMFVHYAFSGRGFSPSTQSPWFQEGLAEYFGGYKVEKAIVDGKEQRIYKLGFFLPWRYFSYQGLKRSGQLLSVRDLIGVDSFQFNKAREEQPEPNARATVSNVYATGWAFVMYMNHAHDGKYKDAFDAYFEAEVNGAGHWESLQNLLGITDAEGWDELNDDFTRWANEELPKINKIEKPPGS